MRGSMVLTTPAYVLLKPEQQKLTLTLTLILTEATAPTAPAFVPLPDEEEVIKVLLLQVVILVLRALIELVALLDVKLAQAT